MRTASVCLAAISVAVLTAGAAGPTQSTASAPAQSAAASSALPAPQELIARHVKAVGGREAVLAYSSRRATGTMSVPASGMEGTLEVFMAKPNKSLMRINLPGVGAMEEGFDGTHGWSINPVTGPSLLQGKQLEDRREESEFGSELTLEKNYTAMKTVEKTDFDGRPCYKVVATRKVGGEDTIYFDVETGLRAGSVATRETPMGPITATTFETGYKQFGKVKYPTRLRISTMGIEQVMTLNTIEHDTVDPNTFALPAPIKALIK
jgi:hypothetical protein